MISAILLAAGESSRMEGAFKPLLKWGKRTVIGACVDSLNKSKVCEIIVVLGHREQEVRSFLAGSGVQYAINPDYRQGMLSSIKTGFAQLSSRPDTVLIALVDQPMVTSDIIDQLIDAYEKGGKKIVVPVSHGRHGHPIIISREFEGEIMLLDDASPEGLRAVVNSHRDEILEVPVISTAVIEDIDRPGDYERLSQKVEPIYEYHRWHP
ncbi:MAG: nucleotidyltransferase family protein [Acidobacteriota bacterium]